MTKTKYHTFDLGRAGKGAIDLRTGLLQYVHEDIAPSSNLMGLGVYHVYNNINAANNVASSCGRGFEIKLSPAYNPNDDFYQTKAQVSMTDNRITLITDKIDTSRTIQFVYSPTTNLLTDIIDTEGRVIKFVYTTSNTLIRIQYRANAASAAYDETYFSSTNAGIINKIVGENKASMELTWDDNNRVTKLKNTLHYVQMDAFFENGISSELAGRDGYGETNFIYETNKTTKTDDAGNQLIYSFYTQPASGATELQKVQDGLTQEELKINGVSKSIVTYARVLSGDNKQEVICYNPNKVDEATITRIYQGSDTDIRLLEETAETSFNEIVDGVVGAKRYKKINKLLTYTNNKLVLETVSVALKTTKTGSADISEKTCIKTYDDNGKLKKVENRLNNVAGIIQEKITDSNPNAEVWETYHASTPNKKICNKKLLDSDDRLSAIYDERGFATNLEYVDGTSLVKKIIDPAGNATDFEYFAGTHHLKSVSAEENGVVNKNEFLYQRDFLARMRSPTTMYDFLYYGKTSDYLSKERIMINNSDFVSNTAKKENNQNKLTATYKNNEKIETVIESTGEKYVDYLPNGENKQRLITNTPLSSDKTWLASSQDHLANTTTYFTYDPQGNVIASENEELKTTVSTDNQGRLKGAKFNLKTLGITQNYTYSYSAIPGEINRATFPNGRAESVTYDSLGRLIYIATPVSTWITYKNDPTGNYTTNLVDCYAQHGINTTYDYDSRGNITDVYQIYARVLHYKYDALNRLVREDNTFLNKTFTYEYDNNGNILNKKTYSYTTGSLNDLTPLNTKTYTYSGDRLLNFGGQTCEYDSLGNPTLYRGTALEWTHLRNLSAINTSGGKISFEYNASGLRTKKNANATETKYFWAGDKLLAERRLPDGIEATLPLDDEVTTFPLDTVIQYLYGFNGVAGFTVTVGDQTESYYYRKNLQGDITHIHNELGTPVAEYVYDAWGNHEITVNTNGIADINPFRYRSYYYDTETKLYYLKSRYYDPETGRFINMDDARILNQSMHMINGLNLYAYCNNNPVMRTDPTGRAWWNNLLNLLGLTAPGISSYSNSPRNTFADVGAAFLVDAGKAFGTIAATVLAGGLTGLILGPVAGFFMGAYAFGSALDFYWKDSDVGNWGKSVMDWTDSTVNKIWNQVIVPAAVWFWDTLLPAYYYVDPLTKYSFTSSALAIPFAGPFIYVGLLAFNMLAIIRMQFFN